MSTTRTCINRYSLPTSVQWQFSGIPPPPQLLTPNLFHPSSGTGEFSGFGPCSGLGALPQDSKPNMPTTAIRLNVRVNSWMFLIISYCIRLGQNLIKVFHLLCEHKKNYGHNKKNIFKHFSAPPAEKSKSPSTHPHHFLQGHIESVLTSCITVWYENCSAADRKILRSTVNTAAKIIGAPLPSILDILRTQCSSKANSIVKDPTHPSHSLFELLPSGRWYRSIRARSARLPTAFSPRLWEPWTHITPPLSETPNNPGKNC